MIRISMIAVLLLFLVCAALYRYKVHETSQDCRISVQQFDGGQYVATYYDLACKDYIVIQNPELSEHLIPESVDPHIFR